MTQNVPRRSDNLPARTFIAIPLQQTNGIISSVSRQQQRQHCPEARLAVQKLSCNPQSQTISTV
jgi:hypothetical protein